MRREGEGIHLVDNVGLGDAGFPTRDWDAESARLAVRAVQAGEPTAWFETLYAGYRTADMLFLPLEWQQAFDLVVEIINIQALPVSLRSGHRGGGEPGR